MLTREEFEQNANLKVFALSYRREWIRAKPRKRKLYGRIRWECPKCGVGNLELVECKRCKTPVKIHPR